VAQAVPCEISGALGQVFLRELPFSYVSSVLETLPIYLNIAVYQNKIQAKPGKFQTEQYSLGCRGALERKTILYCISDFWELKGELNSCVF
jgi:hypothetical protein